MPQHLALNCGFFPRTVVRGKIYVAPATSKREGTIKTVPSLFGCSNYLSSRVVSNKVLSAQVSLTSVFGMSTGGSSPLSSPQWYIVKVLPLEISFLFP